MIVHHLSNSHSHVVLWLLHELDVPHETIFHQREATGRAPESLRSVHPWGKAPMIEDQGVIMIESAGILFYLLERYGQGRLRPEPGSVEAMLFHQWLSFIGCSATPVMPQFIGVRSKAADDPQRVAVEQAAARPLSLIEAALDGHETLVPGLFTPADMQLAFFEEGLEGVGRLKDWPNMNAHLLRMRSRKGYKDAEAEGGPVDLKGLIARISP